MMAKRELADEIRQGIAAYEKEQAVLLRVLRKHGEISDRDFDRIFGDIRYRPRADGTAVVYPRRGKVRFCAFKPESFILGGMSYGDWAKWLDLTQHMARVGLVKIRAQGGRVYYRAAA